MNKIILIILISFLTSCFYREDFHKAKHQKGLSDARKEGRKYKNPYKRVRV
jgi:hypothetical protein